MYPSRGSGSYSQQSYTTQSSYGQNPTSAYPGNSAVGPDGSSQLNAGSLHPPILGGSHEPEIGGYRAHPSAGSQYGGQYSSLYGSASLSSGQQVSVLSAKGSGPSALEGRNYGSVRVESPKYPSADYVPSSSHVYSNKTERSIPEKIADYASFERRQYAERQGAYVGRDLPVEAGGRYADSAGYAHQHKSEMYDRLDHASLLRQDQMLKSQSLQSASHEGARQADYLAVRSASLRRPTQDLASFGGRADAESHIQVVGNSLYGGQSAPSILGAAPRRNMEDLMYSQTSSNPGYGISLPPGRDYGLGKGLLGTALESDFPGSLSSRSGYSRIDEHKDDVYDRELDLREEERRRERLRDKERERERERDRERERERERKRVLELREKERDRDRERKRALESRRERTPSRASKDRRGSSLTKDSKSLRRDSPRREVLHRIHSPVKEKRREYVCKVYTSSLVDVERDYLSLDKRYPRLYVSPDFSKVVVNWPRENLKLPMHTPVSFEHDFVESDAVQKELSSRQSDVESTKSEHRSIVWNAKMILMSGISRSAIEELSSEKISDERIPHICNFLRFAVLKKDRSFMAIGGPWDAADGGDPSVDDSSLVQTILRYAKDLTNLDLQNCQRWNRFLEIHYDRVGKDGLFSHKEVTVLFVPDLSDCLPSLDAWREQWLAHKSIAERERQLSLAKEKSRDKSNALKETSSPKDEKRTPKAEKKEKNVGTGKAADHHGEQDGEAEKASTTEKDGDRDVKNAAVKVAGEQSSEAKNTEKKEVNTSTPATSKPGKKKITRKIVKQKVADKKISGVDGSNGDNKLDEKAVEVKNVNIEVTAQKDTSSADPTSVKTFTRKKAVKKLSDVNAAVKEVKTESGLKSNKQSDGTEDKSGVNLDVVGAAVVRDGPVKRTVKRKIIKRVPKKKSTGEETSNEFANNLTTIDQKDGKNNTNAGKGTDNNGVSKVDEVKASEGGNSEKSPKKQPGVESSKKQDTEALSSATKNRPDNVVKKEEEKTDEKRVSETKKVSAKDNVDHNKEKGKEREKSKDGKERKDKDVKDEQRSKSSKDLDRKKSEEPPRHPGFILQTKSARDAKIRSLSLSLESLLGYSDKDIEESTFELSVFAESFYEMLQYQMGSRVFTFLQKLRIKFVKNRNKRKRQREQADDKQSKEKSKRVKSEESLKEEKPAKSEAKDEPHPNGKKLKSKEDDVVSGADKLEDEGKDVEKEVENEEDMMEEEEEDPEEDPEEDEEMEDGSPGQESTKEGNKEKTEVEQNQTQGDEKERKEQHAEEKTKDDEKKGNKDGEATNSKEVRAEAPKKTTSAPKDAPVDKELLQAFRFFDRNRVGYLRVEDLRLIIHNLGKFLSHRDVKELVQSALLESNTGRDDRILYEKLVKMSLEN